MKIIKCTDKEYPQRLLKIKDYPKQLYVEGNIELLNKNSIAIVGSRLHSKYGEEYATIFANELSKNGITVISGLAKGIDTIAHKESKDYLGNTIAVIGSGFNHIYPKENEKLFKEIIEGNGCIISEYEPNQEIDNTKFPERNRIISGIALGVLVIEAKFRSGSEITATYAMKQGKKVFCIPRNIGEKNGVGTNNLIKKGAKLVTSPNEIMDELEINYNKEENFEIEHKEVKEEYLKVYNYIENIPININELIKKCGLNISEINRILTMLELEGNIKTLPGNEYVRI